MNHCKSYYDCKSTANRVQVHQGGSRSGKTYSICEWLIERAYHNRDKAQSVVTIARKTLPACKATVMRDFMEILLNSNLYDPEAHNKSENTYFLYNTLFEFIGVDNPQKIRGRKRHVNWMNEANEFSFDDFTQLALRTSELNILDYNPSDEFHWIYDHILTRTDCSFFQSTYKDNPFLPDDLRKEIEHLKEIDPNLWAVFGLGERGTTADLIYYNWQMIDDVPEGDKFYGLDFGFNNPSALVEITIKDKNIYLQELIYQNRLTNGELIDKAKMLIANKGLPIYADAAEPQRIQEFYNAGFNIKAADKSVKDGINKLKERRVFYTRNSLNIAKEVKNYKWMKDKEGRVLDEPVKFNDHILDAIRYGVHTHTLQPTGRYAVI